MKLYRQNFLFLEHGTSLPESYGLGYVLHGCQLLSIEATLTEMTAAVNARRGIYVGFSGATLDFARRQLTWTSPLWLTMRRYKIRPMPLSLASEKLSIYVWSGSPKSIGLRLPGNISFSRSKSSVRHFSPNGSMSSDIGSSQMTFVDRVLVIFVCQLVWRVILVRSSGS